MAITWSTLEKQFAPDVADHWARAQPLGLDCSLDVFEQLFNDHRGDETFANGVQDDRPEIADHWHTAGTWLGRRVPP
ncbi:MAG TPA: hypothetical protein VIY90_21205 [Steroidobacteraceae bacterium]